MSYRGAPAVLCLAAFACSRGSSGSGTQRIAILRFENLSGDASLDWMGRGFPEILSRELAGAPGIYAIAPSRLHSLQPAFGPRPGGVPGVSSERELAQAAGANQIGYGEYWLRHGRVEARLTLEGVPSGSTRVVSSSGGGIADAAAGLARSISSRAGPYATANSAAIEAYVLGLDEGDAAAAAHHFADAISADPAFEQPYQALVQFELQQRDRTAASGLLNQAVSHRDRMPEIERAQLALVIATANGNPAGRRQALTAEAGLTPNDPAVWTGLAETEMATRQYTHAVEAYQKALTIQPDDPAVLNQLGYATAWAGDVEGAVRVLERYRALRPADGNPSDSLGDIYLLSGRLHEAEINYLEAARKDPGLNGGGEYRKAAMARLMTGDLSGAAALDRQYTDRRAGAHDPLVEYYRAEWDWISGSRQQGYQRLAAFGRVAETSPLKPAAAEAYAQLAVWSVALGNRAAAAQMASQAGFLAGSQAGALVAIAQFLAQPSAAADEWIARANHAFPAPAQKPVRDRALAYALLADRHYPEAAQILKPLYDAGGTDTDQSPAITLAWCDLEGNSPKDVADLLRFNPLPPRNGIDPFRVFYFPRLFYLRGRLAAQSGQPDAARRQFQLFLRLSGETALVWGEEQQAR